jgi:S-formylglutathione hydrolase FrmB
VKYPEVFSTFVNIDGDIAPNTGTKAQTIERLFGGDAAKYAEWDPTTLITEHGRYKDAAGWFAVSTAPGTASAPIPGSELPEPPDNVVANTPVDAARALCGLGDAYGIDCAVVPLGGKHDWPFAERVLAASLPWLAARIETPDVPEVLLPGTATQPDGVSIAADGGTRATPTPRLTGVR